MNPLQWLVLEGGPAPTVAALILSAYAFGRIMRALERREIRAHLRRLRGWDA